MDKKLVFDYSPDNRIKRAKDAIAIDNYIDAMGILNDAIFLDPMNKEARFLAADIYNEILQYEFANQYYFQLIALGDRSRAISGLINNFLRSGNFSLARYYNETYDVKYDFSQLLSGEEDYAEEDEYEDDNSHKNLRLIVSRKELGEANALSEESEYIFDENFDFGKILENLVGGKPMEMVGADLLDSHKPTLKQVFPMPDEECTTILNKGIQHFMAHRYDLALSTLDKISPRNVKFYLEAQKYKAMCFLSQTKYVQMRECLENALKYKPDDFTLKCYYAISLKLLDENELADKAFSDIREFTTGDIAELMNKLDVCRLFMYHQGVYDCSTKILEEFSFNNIFWLQNIKALYNLGKKKEAEYSVAYLIKLYPYFWEARDTRYRIKYEDDLLEYGDGSFMLSRSLAQGHIEEKIASKVDPSRLFDTSYERLRLRYSLSGADDSPQKLDKFFALFQNIPSKGLYYEMYNVLLDNRTANEVKINSFFTLYNVKNFSRICLVVDNIYKEISDFDLPNSQKTPKVLTEAYGYALAEIMVTSRHYEKYAEALKTYTLSIINTLEKLDNTDELLITVSLLKNVRVLAKALMEKVNIKNESPKRKGLAEIKSNLTNRYKAILQQLEDRNNDN